MNRLTIASPIDEPAHAYAVVQRGDDSRAFGRAIRHSRRVRFLRWAIPFSILAGGALGLLAERLGPLHMFSALPVDFSSLVVSGTKITMQAPRVAGFTADGRPYEVTGRAAAQDVTKPDTIELQGIQGKGEMPDRTIFEVTADAGTYDSKRDMLTLRQNVVIKSSSGFEVYLNEAVIDVHNSNVVSEKPVQVKLQQGTINANRMEVVNSGEEIRFGGGVSMVMTSGNQAMHLSGRLGVP
ncbi:MAG TPA: LPS export ABC transporter periplasmic protein LptC [Xanthobacteraceae bacterium]|nr:LPS export ABC transporter periplasmic protein LptC [Xanthobacteraceae bacterium]